MFMDMHEGPGDASETDVAAAHQRDLEVQGTFGERYLTYRFNDPAGQVFCPVDAPDMDIAVACHKEADGLLPHRMIEVTTPTPGHFLGDWEQNIPDRAMITGPGSEPRQRFTGNHVYRHRRFHRHQQPTR
jgi:hypothetical protein